MDSNHRRRKPADLQSAPFGHSGICPFQSLNLAVVSKCDFQTAAKLDIYFIRTKLLAFFFTLYVVFLCISRPDAVMHQHIGLWPPQKCR